MKTKLEQLRCGECGGEIHKLYLRPASEEIVVECVSCKSLSVISIPKPQLKIENYSGGGTLCVF